MKCFRFASLAAWIVLGASFIAAPAHADKVTDGLKTTLQQRLGSDAVIKEISKTPIPGIYEVFVGSQIIYVDATGRYALLGNMVDTQNSVNLTEQRLSDLNRIDFATLDLSNAIKYVKGSGARKIAVFADPNCGYCKRFEAELKNVNNITVYSFLFPILSDDSVQKARSLWCSKDRTEAWQDWMVDGKKPSAVPTCDTSVLDKNLALGRQLGVNGTPTIFLSDGRRLPGAVPAKELESALSTVR